MVGQSVISKKKPGPPATGKGTPVLVRLQPTMLAALDDHIASSASYGRPQAIRLILADWLRTHGHLKGDHPIPAGPATDAVKRMDAEIEEHRRSGQAATGTSLPNALRPRRRKMGSHVMPEKAK